MNSVNELYSRLKGDPSRKAHPFSNDIRGANELLHNSSTFEDEVAECLCSWCRTQQPCRFGMLAAKERRIHWCVLSDEAVARWSDEDIAAQIAADQRLWKQRAAFDLDHAAHSFILVVASLEGRSGGAGRKSQGVFQCDSPTKRLVGRTASICQACK